MPSIVDETVVFGTHEENTLAQMADVAQRAERTALMADGHLGYIMPIGGVAAYTNKVSVAGVGYDIACGNAAIQTNLTLTDLGQTEIGLHRALTELADEIQATVSFGVGRNNLADDAPTDHMLFDDSAWEAIPTTHRTGLRAKARNQLGTVGSGNHYVDIFSDEVGTIWVGVHFGSRGFGHTVASNTMALAQGEVWGTKVKEEEALLGLDTPLGDAYWNLMELAGVYAYAGREWVARKVVSILGGQEIRLVHNHHNFAWKERHRGYDYVVVRKGATPSWPGQEGFVGGSMGDNSVILRGADTDDEAVCELQRDTLYSTVHGAGRVMGRSAALGKVDWKTKQLKLTAEGVPVRPGRVSQEMMDSWMRSSGVILRGGGRDESPQVYRRLPEVLREQGDTIEVEHQLQPLVVVMAGVNEFDPYKD